MNIAVKTPLMADKIKELLDGNTFDGVDFTFLEMKGMEIIFSVTGDSEQIAVAATKNAIKATDYGRGLYFSVIVK
ncbi:hypothetical protein [Bacillus sp. FJAT-29814]|uniref:hypothetical protein n=1 Tax=Bacillus sp. FJAT-29814 TaxID=1729688 RepID=UPI00082A060E|nr:hypothetical protein [Bacillus sp. FJAT-29814]